MKHAILVDLLSVFMFAMLSVAFFAPVFAVLFGIEYGAAVRFLLILSLIGGIFVVFKSK